MSRDSQARTTTASAFYFADGIRSDTAFDGVSATGSALASFEPRGGRSGTLLSLELEDVLSDGLLLIDSLGESGFLEPDTYQITVVASAQLDGVANALGEGASGFGFDLIVVPEPSSAALQAGALVALALVARLHGRRWENGARTRTGPARSLRS